MIVNELIMTHKTGRQQATGNSCPTIGNRQLQSFRQSYTYSEQSVVETFYPFPDYDLVWHWDSCFVFLSLLLLLIYVF